MFWPGLVKCYSDDFLKSALTFSIHVKAKINSLWVLGDIAAFVIRICEAL